MIWISRIWKWEQRAYSLNRRHAVLKKDSPVYLQHFSEMRGQEKKTFFFFSIDLLFGLDVNITLLSLGPFLYVAVRVMRSKSSLLVIIALDTTKCSFLKEISSTHQIYGLDNHIVISMKNLKNGEKSKNCVQIAIKLIWPKRKKKSNMT